MKINLFLKYVLYIFVIVYFILILVKMYCWWEGFFFPITFSSNKLLKLYDKVDFLPFVISSLVLVYSISNKKRKVIKITALVLLVLSNFILFKEGDFTNQWFDANPDDKGLVVKQIYDSDIESTETRIRSFRIVKKKDICSVFSFVSNADTISTPHINQLWMGTPWK